MVGMKLELVFQPSNPEGIVTMTPYQRIPDVGWQVVDSGTGIEPDSLAAETATYLTSIFPENDITV